MESKSEAVSPAEIALNVLGYREADSWVALALEMDLRGYGKNFEEAIEDLKELVGMQISFAYFKGQTEMIFRPAEPIWFELFAEARFERIRRIAEKAKNPEYEIRSMPVPPPHVIEALAKKFRQSNG